MPILTAWIPISNASKLLLDDYVRNRLLGGGIRKATLAEDADWMIELSASTLARLEGLMLPWESYDDVIQRVHAQVKGLQ